MTQKITRLCPYANWEKSCSQVLGELKEKNQTCHFITVTETQTPQGRIKMALCVHEATAVAVANITQLLSSMLRNAGLPKIYLPGQTGPN